MPKPQPPNSDALLEQLQAYVDAMIAAAVSALGIDVIRSRLDALEVRTLALEEATPPGSLPGEVRWRSSLVRLVGAPSGATTSNSVSVSWERTSASQQMPQSVSLALDGGTPEPAQEGEVKTWSDLPAGTHYICALINGIDEDRDTWVILEDQNG